MPFRVASPGFLKIYRIVLSFHCLDVFVSNRDLNSRLNEIVGFDFRFLLFFIGRWIVELLEILNIWKELIRLDHKSHADYASLIQDYIKM